ncbi:MAG: (2Fe-2S)-binding protein [Actinomycetota bacterium]|nr:(2Fe-2S)-binding protein [Actinomycetota bacterium]
MAYLTAARRSVVIVCHCAVVSDRDLVAAAAAGATSTRALCRATGAGRNCGGCLPAVQAVAWQTAGSHSPCSRGGPACSRSVPASSSYSTTPSPSN